MSGDGFARHTPTLSGTKITRALSIDSALIPHVSDAIAQLTFESNWLEVDDPIDDIIEECFEALDGWYLGVMFIGQISQFLGNVPASWLELDGSSYNKVDYPELWEAIDSQYRDATTFTLPDFSGLFLAAAGAGSYDLGDTGGTDDHTLTAAEMPAHTHTYLPPVVDLDLEAVGVPDIMAARLGTPIATGSAGSDNAHENRPPFHAVTMGVFAGRE